MSIRERRILQLETQINVASEVVAGRDIENLAEKPSENNRFQIIEERLTLLSQKVDSLGHGLSNPGTSNNIYITSSGSIQRDKRNQQCQTETDTCLVIDNIGDIATKSKTNLPPHTMAAHAGGTAQTDFACDFCGVFCLTFEDLQGHVESNHVHIEDCEDMALSTPAGPSTTQSNTADNL